MSPYRSVVHRRAAGASATYIVHLAMLGGSRVVANISLSLDGRSNSRIVGADPAAVVKDLRAQEGCCQSLLVRGRPRLG
ncbi:MAG TPA: hypothetical protein VGJ44_00070, partial [Kribbellaceae bacterium]